MRIALYILIIFIYTFDHAAFQTITTKSRKHSKVKHLLAKHNHRNKSISIDSSSGKPALAFVFSTTSKPSKDVPIKLTTTQNLSKDGVKKRQRYLRKERTKLRKLLKNKKNHYNSEEATSILSKINQINEELKKYGSKYGKKRRRIKKPMNYSKKTNSNADILEITTAQNKNFVFKWSLKNDTLNQVINKLNKNPEQNLRSHSFNAQSDGFSPTTVETVVDKTFKSITSNLLKSKRLEHKTNIRNISIISNNKVDNTRHIRMGNWSISSPQQNLSNNDFYNTTESSRIPEDNVSNINYASLMIIQSTTIPPIKNLSLDTILNEFNAISDQLNDVLPGTNTYHKINMTRKIVMRKNINRCSIRKGGCEHICRPRGPNKCSCMPGFRLSGNRRNCVDINECQNANSGCKGICKNTPGSYYCTCPPGLRLSDDKISCEDLNECLLRNGHGPCQDTCINSYGSYECSCSALAGTRLSNDKHSCEDINECFDNRIGCSHNCVNTLGRAFCTCPDGMLLGDDWKTCIDIDECEDEETQKQCKHGCLNLVGSYRCIESYEFQSDQTVFDISDYVACPKLLPPKHGFLECSRDKVLEIKAKTKSGRKRITNRPGTFCQLICPDGYKTLGKYKLTCGFDGEWFGEKMGKCTKHHL